MAAINKENEKILTQARVREVLSYNIGTGAFTWKTSTTRSVKIGDVAGCINKSDGYRQIMIDGKIYKAHRLVWLYMFGKFPDKYIDHISGISDDNRLCNLRDVTHQENQKNRPLQRNNKSGTPGVRWYKKLNKWETSITIDGKFTYLGCFTDKEDAVKARKEAERKYGFHPNHGKVLVKGESR